MLGVCARAASRSRRTNSVCSPLAFCSSTAASGMLMHREMIVSGSTSGIALSKSNRESCGGSSNVLRDALAACGCRRSASARIATFRRPSVARICSACSSARTCSMTIRRDFDSGSATKVSRAAPVKTSSGLLPFTRWTNFAASKRFPLPGAPEMR